MSAGAGDDWPMDYAEFVRIRKRFVGYSSIETAADYLRAAVSARGRFLIDEPMLAEAALNVGNWLEVLTLDEALKE
jgi:hypothetical protein